MRWNDDALYRLFLRRDPSLNGSFLTGVLSTGIYCLPSCPARRPLRQNVRFFRTPDEAVSSGLRPCRRCHPDSFYRGEEWHEDLFEKTAARVRSGPAAFRDVSDLARASGLSRTALNDLFRDHAQESPAVFLRRARVEHVCGLLASGIRPLDAAAASGFGSSSAFHQQFTSQTGMTPGAYSGLAAATEFSLALPTGYRADEVLAFHRRDPGGASERVSGNTITKCLVRPDGTAGILEMRLEPHRAHCRVEGLLAPDAHRIALRMLGLGQDAAGFERQFASDPLLGPLIQKRAGLRIPMSATPWEGMAWAIVGQQISLTIAITLRRRLIALAGVPHASGLLAHPGPETVARLSVDDLRALKFSRSKAEYLVGAARAIVAGELDLDSLRSASAKHAARLLAGLRGIGPWTIDYMFLRALGFPDSLPAGDAGIAQALARLTGTRPNQKQIRELTAPFAPYRSFAAAHIWASLKEEQSL